MLHNSRAIVATLTGAVIGGLAGYLFYTEHGRQFRRSLEPALDDIATELNSFRATLSKAVGVASEGWNLLSDAAGESAAGHTRRFPGTHQSSPF